MITDLIESAMGRGGVNCRFVAVQKVGMEGMMLAANSNVHAKIWPWRLFHVILFMPAKLSHETDEELKVTFQRI